MACVLAATTVLAVATPATAAPTAQVERSAASAPAILGEVTFINDHSSLFMAIRGASRAHGAPAIQWPFEANNARNDAFFWEGDLNGSVLMRLKPSHTYSNDNNVRNDMCLAVEGASNLRNARIVQATCTYDSVNNDVWRADFNARQGYLQNHKSGLCLVVKNASRERGAELIQHDCNLTDNGWWFW